MEQFQSDAYIHIIILWYMYYAYVRYTVLHCNSDQEIRSEFTAYYYGTVLL